MEYSGDYGIEDFLAKGGATSDSEVADYLISFLSRGFYKFLIMNIRIKIYLINMNCLLAKTQIIIFMTGI